MNRTTGAASQSPAPTRPRRRRPARPLDPFEVLPGDRTAAAMDDAAEAEALFADLLALVDAGLVEAIDDWQAVRYAAIEENTENAPVSRAGDRATSDLGSQQVIHRLDKT